MGIPVVGQEHLPVEHPGPAHLVRDPRQQGRLHRARAGDVDLMVALNADDLREGRRARCARAATCSTTRRWPLDADAARATTSPSSASRSREHVQRDLQGRARAHPDEEHRLRRRAGRAARHRHATSIRAAARREVRARSRRCSTSNHKAIELGYDYAQASTSTARCRSGSRRWTRPTTRILIDGNTARRRSAASTPAPPSAPGIRSRRPRR